MSLILEYPIPGGQRTLCGRGLLLAAHAKCKYSPVVDTPAIQRPRMLERLNAELADHHLGINIWAGSGAAPPAEHDARQLEWTIELPDATSLPLVVESLVRGGYPTALEGDPARGIELVTRDPWGTQLRLVPRGTAAPPSSSSKPLPGGLCARIRIRRRRRETRQ